MTWNTIDVQGRDGWRLETAITHDHTYRPGEDDDVYPRLTPCLNYNLPEGALGPFSGVVQGEYYQVTAEEVERLTELGGGDPETMRKQLEADAEAIASQSLEWVVVRVRATRETLEGFDYLGGVDVDHRLEDPFAYARGVIEDYDMGAEAIADALEHERTDR